MVERSRMSPGQWWPILQETGQGRGKSQGPSWQGIPKAPLWGVTGVTPERWGFPPQLSLLRAFKD